MDPPTSFLVALFVVTAAGYLLPIRVEGREDHIVLTIAATVDAAILGPKVLLLVWGGLVVAAPVVAAARSLRPPGPTTEAAGPARAVGWMLLSAVAITVGFAVGYPLYTGLFGRTYPVPVATFADVIVAIVVSVVSWIGSMSVRFGMQRVTSGPLTRGAFDPFDSILIPYLYPLVGGFPIVAACVALYRPSDPWSSLLILLWAFPLYALTALDLHRRRLAQALRRDVVAKQRLAAIGELSARVVHQSRHQVALMGWSIHRLRGTIGSSSPEAVAAARGELDALVAAKDRLSAMLASELLHEPTPAGSVGEIVAVATLAGEVVVQLEVAATTQGIDLVLSVGPEVADRCVRRALFDVLFNLVDNAIDAATSRVTIRLDGPDGPGGPVVLQVDDDGPGLLEADVDRAFEPLFTTKPDGTGMGLAIADALVGDLGGELRYQRIGATTTFIVRVPAAVALAAATTDP